MMGSPSCTVKLEKSLVGFCCPYVDFTVDRVLRKQWASHFVILGLGESS